MKKTMNEFLAEVRKATLDPTLVSELEANVAEAAKAEVAVVETAEKATKEEKNMNKNIDKGFQLSEAIAIIKAEERVNFLGMEIRKVDDKTFLFNSRVYQSAEAVVSAAILADSKKKVSGFAAKFVAKTKGAAIAGRIYGGVAVEASKDLGRKTAEETKKAAGKVGQKLVDFSK